MITIGIVQDGKASYTVYGKNGAVLPQAEHIYEIGSLTKTITASLLFKAIDEGMIGLDDTVDKYLDLPRKDYYPTGRRLITHTSGYEDYYYDGSWVSNVSSFILNNENPFNGVDGEMLIERVGKIDLEDRDYEFNYSNFGISLVGAVLSEVYGKSYSMLINDYLDEELLLEKTVISDGSGDLGRYWNWAENDAYMPAGALASTIGDMLEYAQMQMRETPDYLSDTHETLAPVDETRAIGASWIIDSDKRIIWHNGGTGEYNCFLGFSLETQTAVVVLSNLPADYRIPLQATVIGTELLTDLQRQDRK